MSKEKIYSNKLDQYGLVYLKDTKTGDIFAYVQTGATDVSKEIRLHALNLAQLIKLGVVQEWNGVTESIEDSVDKGNHLKAIGLALYFSTFIPGGYVPSAVAFGKKTWELARKIKGKIEKPQRTSDGELEGKKLK